MANGYLAIVLHAHLPYARADRPRGNREDYRFLEYARECYLPLIRVLDQWEHDQIPARITLSLSPTLITLMQASQVQARLAEHLDRMIELSSREMNRTALQPELYNLTGAYHLRLLQLRNAFVDRCGGNLLHAFADLASRGRVELITGPASHAFLPGMVAMQRQAARGQIRVGLQAFRDALGFPTAGFWLPECAYTPELDELLGTEGVRYTVVDGRALEHASPPAVHGVMAPVHCPSGVAAFGRDRLGADGMGGDALGRPQDGAYRDNRRDIGDELPYEYLRPYMPAEGVRLPTGFRYHRLEGENGRSSIYDRKAALNRAAEQAQTFIGQQQWRANEARGRMDRPALFVAAYDLHVFGHRWFEGTEFLDYLLRKIHFDQDVLESITPAEYLLRHPCNQMTTPAASSWSDDGYFQQWVGPDTAWIYRHLSRAGRILHHLTVSVNGNGDSEGSKPDRDADNLPGRALRAAARQLVLAQSSDWMTMMRNGDTADYGRQRLALHLRNFARVASQIEGQAIDTATLEQLERDWPIFDTLRTDTYR